MPPTALIMAQPTYQIQVLEKSDYTKQCLVSVPKALPQLTAGAIRVQSRMLSITSNTFLYARLGHLLHWWDVWAPISSLPAPYRDGSKYGRISSWGYAEVVESMHDRVPVGTELFGYLPIGDRPEIMEVDIDAETGHVIETSQRRHQLMNIYNRYLPLSSPKTDPAADRASRGWDSAMRVLFETSYLLNRYAFSWEEGKQCHPMGILPSPAPWSGRDADLTDAVVLLLGASGKTALTFAYQLRHGRPAESRPGKVVAVGSTASRDFSSNAGLFDDIVLYSDSGNTGVMERLGIDRDTKTLMVNFGARGEADRDWFAALKAVSDSATALMIGSDPKLNRRSELAALAEKPNSGVVRGNASTLRDSAMAIDGQAGYFEGLEEDWARFKGQAGALGLKLHWGIGMQEFRDGWDGLCAGTVDPTLGLVYEV